MVPTVKPRSWLFDLFGDYVEHRDREVWTGSVIALAAEFGLSERAIRSTVLRMQRDGWLHVRRAGARSYYALTDAGRRLIDRGRERIFRGPQQEWDGRWCVLTYSIPESQRDLRDKLRRELTWLGFGGLTNGMFISPHDHSFDLGELAGRHGLAEHITVFRAEHIWPGNNRALAARCWDLQGINAAYAEFLGAFEPYRSRANMSDRECFVVRSRLINAYKRFPFLDPGLPPELLPPDWLGKPAADLFRELHAHLTAGAIRFFDHFYELGRQSGAA